MKRKNTSRNFAKAFLYQWTKFNEDFDDLSKLGKLGGNREAAKRFRGIEADLRETPSQAHWIVAARRKNGNWGVSALFRVRQPTLDEGRAIGDWDKCLYLDEEESGFVALPGEEPLIIDSINHALQKKLPGQTEGFNGVLIEIPHDVIEDLRGRIKLTIKSRKEVLSSLRSGTGSSESEGPGSDIDSTVPNGEQRNPAITADDQATLASDTPNLKTDEREAIVKVRFGQGSFRDALFKEKGYGEKCWMSGIEGRRLLIASHIKPWSHCDDDPDSRGRTDNGLLLSALWDAAFDAGLLSFAPDWKVIVSSELSESAKAALNLDAQSTLPEIFRTDGRKEYLAYHHAKVFEYWKKKELP